MAKRHPRRALGLPMHRRYGVESFIDDLACPLPRPVNLVLGPREARSRGHPNQGTLGLLAKVDIGGVGWLGTKQKNYPREYFAMRSRSGGLRILPLALRSKGSIWVSMAIGTLN